MRQNDFRKLQMTQMEILDEAHRICEDANIKYYIIGGTALGAVRHGGFIPWDIDMDIAMPRDDYDRFKIACESSLNDRFIYRDYMNTRSFTRPHALISIKGTSLKTRTAKYNVHEKDLGIYLDIFPLDNAPDDRDQQIKQASAIRRINRKRYIKMARMYDKSMVKKIVKEIRKLSLFYVSIDDLNAELDHEMRRFESCDTRYMCSMASHYSYEKQCMPKEIYGVPQLVKFEDREYFAPAKIEEYLTRIYKDYMKLPPESDRQASMDYFETVVFDN